jgi:hypothetical protein
MCIYCHRADTGQYRIASIGPHGPIRGDRSTTIFIETHIIERGLERVHYIGVVSNFDCKSRAHHPVACARGMVESAQCVQINAYFAQENDLLTRPKRRSTRRARRMRMTPMLLRHPFSRQCLDLSFSDSRILPLSLPVLAPLSHSFRVDLYLTLSSHNLEANMSEYTRET